MRRLMLPVVGVCLALLWSQPGAAQQDEALTFLDKAIKAHGGEDKLRATMATHVKAKGKAMDGGNEIAFTLEGFFQLPDKVKVVMELTIQNNNITAVVVYDGKDVYSDIMGKKDAIRDALAKELKNSVYRE
jgi:hypothetical protein